MTSKDKQDTGGASGQDSQKHPAAKTGMSPAIKVLIVLGVGIVLLCITIIIIAVSIFDTAKKEQKATTVAEKKQAAQARKEDKLSPSQKKIFNAFGQPKQFILAYTPAGNKSSSTLVRNEVWFYPEHRKKINFIGGKIFSTGKTGDPGPDTEYSEFGPEDFDFSMNYKQVVKAIGNSKVTPVKFANDLFKEDDVKSYVAGKVIFTIEKGHLVYMQTVGVRR